MYTQTLTALTALVFLIGFSHADEQHADQASMEEANELNKRSQELFYMPRASNWISSRPSKSLNSANDDIGYLLQYLDKRSGEFSEEIDGGERSIRSPLGTMRFGKRASGPLGTMRFGKRASGPLGTMRFGKRDSPLGTMRFGKRESAPLGTMRFGRR